MKVSIMKNSKEIATIEDVYYLVCLKDGTLEIACSDEGENKVYIYHRHDYDWYCIIDRR